MSIMRSNATSVTSEATTVILLLSKLTTTQAICSGDHVARSYDRQVSPAGPKQSNLITHPYDTCEMTRFTIYSPMISRKDLP